MQRSGEYLDNSTDKSGEIMASDDELEQRLLADELSDKNEATTVKSMPEVLTSLVDKVEAMSSKIFNMDKSIKRLQSNRDAPCSTEGPSKKQRLTTQIEVEEDDDNSDAEGLRRRNEPDADSANEGHMSDTRVRLEHDALLQEISHDLEQEEESAVEETPTKVDLSPQKDLDIYSQSPTTTITPNKEVTKQTLENLQPGFAKDSKGGIRGAGHHTEVADPILVASGNENVDAVTHHPPTNTINNIPSQQPIRETSSSRETSANHVSLIREQFENRGFSTTATEILESAWRAGCSSPLGLEDGRVQNSQFRSYTYHENWPPFEARLNKGGAWCSDENDVNHEFLQIDLRNVQHISQIATQGVHGSWSWRSYFVQTFVIEYSYDGTTWFTYQGSGGSIQSQTFHGNSDYSSVKNNYFRDTFVTRYLRIYPKTYYNDMCLRVELYGCNNHSGCSNALGLEDGRVQNSQFSSYTYATSWDPFRARLNKVGAWCSKANDVNHEFLQIDLRNVQHISRIATQGVSGSYWRSYYVETFVIEYSYDGTTWFTYKGSDASIQTFHGNSDASSVKNNYFRDTFVTRYIRIYPKTFYRHMCLRVELYGCKNQSDDCSTYITTASGSINSLSFPGSYPGNKDCTWLIEVSKDKNITLMFTQFDVYQGSNAGGCKNDYVEVRDGLIDSSPVIGGKYCNQNRTMLITTNKNVARIYFHTGITNLDHKGFQLYFLSVTKGSDDVLSGAACDGEVLALDCSGYQHTINILHALYQIGSYPFSCGQRHNYSSSTSCPAFDAMGEVVSKCQDYKKCLITVNESSFPGQSCARVRRQLEVFYQCNSTKVKTPAPTPQLTTSTTSATTPTTSATTPSPFTIKTHMSHSLTSLVTESPTNVKATETPDVTLSKKTTKSTDPITEVTSTRTVDPIVGRREDQITGSVTTRTLVLILVVAAIAVVVITLLIALFLYRKKRQRKDKKDVLPVVGFIPESKYSKANNGRCILTYSGSGNEYDTTNILYQSADSFSDQSSNKNEDGNPYASSPLLGGSMKVTENPLYPKVSAPYSKLAANGKVGYELVKSPRKGCDSPSNSPQQRPKMNCIHNPNYDKTLPFNHEYTVPKVENVDPQGKKCHV